MRVCWPGQVLPRPGDALLSRAERQVYRIRRVKVLHGDPTSSLPRLILTVLRFGKNAGTGIAGGTVYPWQAIACPPEPAQVPAVARPVPPITKSPSVDDRARSAKEARLASEAAPPVRSDVSVWIDPDGVINTRSPKTVRGRRRSNEIWRMQARGSDITVDHLEAGLRFQLDWDAARLGFTSGNPLQEKVGGSSAGPTTGPSVLASRRAGCGRDVERLLAFVGPAAVGLLMAVLVHNQSIPVWCSLEAARTGDKRRDPKKESGRFLGIMDHLCLFYGVDSAADRIKAIRAEGSGR